MQDGSGMVNTRYTRTTGLRLTYDISATERGIYSVWLGAKELMRGRDSLTARGKRCVPNKRKAAGAVREAQIAIERLSSMDEC
jgi:hypothetical protein